MVEYAEHMGVPTKPPPQSAPDAKARDEVPPLQRKPSIIPIAARGAKQLPALSRLHGVRRHGGRLGPTPRLVE